MNDALASYEFANQVINSEEPLEQFAPYLQRLRKKRKGFLWEHAGDHCK